MNIDKKNLNIKYFINIGLKLQSEPKNDLDGIIKSNSNLPILGIIKLYYHLYNKLTEAHWISERAEVEKNPKIRGLNSFTKSHSWADLPETPYKNSWSY